MKKEGLLAGVRGLLGRQATASPPKQLGKTDARSAPRQDSLQQIVEDLGAHLLNHPHAGSMPHIALVHRVLRKRGWIGVQALPSRFIARARSQAELLNADAATWPMRELLDRLATSRAAAEVREDRQATPSPAVVLPPSGESTVERVIVAEATQEEFEDLERSWSGLLPEGVAAALTARGEDR